MRPVSRRVVSRRCAAPLAVFLLAGCAAHRFVDGAPAAVVLRGARVDVPLVEDSAGRFRVPVFIEGYGAADAFLDTGAATTVLPDAVADALDFSHARSDLYVNGATASHRRSARRGFVRSLRIGSDAADLTCHRVPALVFADVNLPPVVGSALFDGGLLTLDFPGKRLRFEPGALPAADGVAVFDCDFGGDGTPWVEIGIGGARRRVVLDTGANHGVGGDEPFWEGIPRADVERELLQWTVEGLRRVRGGRLPVPLSIGGVACDRLTYVRCEGPPVVGMQALRRFVVTLDRANRRVRFVDGGAPPSAP